MLKAKGDHHMGFGKWKEIIPLDKSKPGGRRTESIHLFTEKKLEVV